MAQRGADGRFTGERAKVAPPSPGVATGKRAIALGGRLSWDDAFQSLGQYPFILQPPLQIDQAWTALKLDDSIIDKMPPERLLSMLADLSPDISRGLWDYLRLFNPGHKIQAFRPGSLQNNANGTIDQNAQSLLDQFLSRLDDIHGSVEVVFNRLAAGAFLRGAFLAELVLDESGRVPLDLATPDPSTVRFRRFVDPVIGPMWQMVQSQGGMIILLDRPTIRYVPIDPMPGNPYGRPLCSPAMFISLFLLGFMRDLRRVIAQQGYPRHDIEVLTSQMANQLSKAQMQDQAYLRQWISDTVNEITTAYAALEPDEAFVHTDAVKVNAPVGAVDSNTLGSVDPLMRMLERMAIKALKSMPILSGMTEGTTETNANRQWEIQAASMRSMQFLCSTMLERLFTMALQVQGVVADVRVQFDEIRSSEEMRDEQSFGLRLGNAKQAYYAGYWSQEQAAQHAVKSKPDQKEPRLVESTEVVDPESEPTVENTGGLENPDPGSAKGKALARSIGNGAPTQGDKGRLVLDWNATMPERLHGLLSAPVEGTAA